MGTRLFQTIAAPPPNEELLCEEGCGERITKCEKCKTPFWEDDWVYCKQEMTIIKGKERLKCTHFCKKCGLRIHKKEKLELIRYD